MTTIQAETFQQVLIPASAGAFTWAALLGAQPDEAMSLIGWLGGRVNPWQAYFAVENKVANGPHVYSRIRVEFNHPTQPFPAAVWTLNQGTGELLTELMTAHLSVQVYGTERLSVSPSGVRLNNEPGLNITKLLATADNSETVIKINEIIDELQKRLG